MRTEQNSQYRREGSHLYKFDAASNCFIHVYQNPRFKTLAALVRAYEAEE